MTRKTIRVARRLRRCDYGYSLSCTKRIEPGDTYTESVASPNHDGLGNPRWMRIHACTGCIPVALGGPR